MGQGREQGRPSTRARRCPSCSLRRAIAMATCPTCRTHYPDDTQTCAADGATLLPDEAFSSADSDLKPGEKVGEYQIEGKLGEGGFGAVSRAVPPLIGKAAAVKVLNRQYSSSP